MGWKYRKSIKLLPGVRLNLNKKSRSISIGGKSHHVTYSSTGRVTKSIGIPGTGLYHTSTVKKGGKQPANPSVEYSPKTYRVVGTLWYVLSALWCFMSIAVLSFSAWGLVFVLFAVLSFRLARTYRKMGRVIESTKNHFGNYLFTPEPADEPTERQLAYAKDLGVKIPKGACRADVSALISRAEENDENQAAPEFLAYLAARGWRGSSLIGHNASLALVYNFVDNTREQIALCAYHFDQAEKGLTLGNLDNAPNKEHYLAFADHVLQTPKSLEHYQSWRRDNTWSAAKVWGIYKDYKGFCHENI